MTPQLGSKFNSRVGIIAHGRPFSCMDSHAKSKGLNILYRTPGYFQDLNISRSWKFPGGCQGNNPWKFSGPGNFQGGACGNSLEISRWWKIKFLNVRRNRHFHIKHKFESHPGWQFTISSWYHENICTKRWPSGLKSWLFEKNMTLLTPKWRNS